MYAVVLVGGFGTRLRPLTNEVPKPVLPINRRPMIIRLVEWLEHAGVTDVVLGLGFLPDPFISLFPESRHGDVRLHYAVEPEPLDTGGAIAFAARAASIDDTFVVVNGDVVTELDAATMITAHRQLRTSNGVDATIHLSPVADPSAFGVVETDGNLVRRFLEKPAPGTTDSNMINAGTYVFEPAVLDLIEPGRRVSVEREVFPELVARGRLAAYPTDDYWIDTGRPELYRQANLDLISGVRAVTESGISPSAEIDLGATVVDSVVDADCHVAPGATVVESVLLPGAMVADGAHVVRSVVAGAVGARARIEDCVVGAGARIEPDEQLANSRRPDPDASNS